MSRLQITTTASRKSCLYMMTFKTSRPESHFMASSRGMQNTHREQNGLRHGPQLLEALQQRHSLHTAAGSHNGEAVVLQQAQHAVR